MVETLYDSYQKYLLRLLKLRMICYVATFANIINGRQYPYLTNICDKPNYDDTVAFIGGTW